MVSTMAAGWACRRCTATAPAPLHFDARTAGWAQAHSLNSRGTGRALAQRRAGCGQGVAPIWKFRIAH